MDEIFCSEFISIVLKLNKEKYKMNMIQKIYRCKKGKNYRYMFVTERLRAIKLSRERLRYENDD